MEVTMRIGVFVMYIITAVVQYAGGQMVNLAEMLSPTRYDKDQRPMVNGDTVTRVAVSVYFQSISNINEVDMDYFADIYLRQAWTDTRLAFSHVKNGTMNVKYPWLKEMWYPDAYFVNSKEEKFRTVTTPNIQISLRSDGRINFSQRLALKVSCELDLHRFPMDEQLCQLKIMTYSHTTTSMVYAWDTEQESVELDVAVNLAEFKLKGTNGGDCTQKYSLGIFSCVSAQFRLERRLEYYLIQTYIPSILLILLSWVSFWIDPRSAPARVSLSLICVLTVTTQTTGSRQNLPRVSYIKSLDIWLSTCLIFVFAALVEYAIVNSMVRKHDSYRRRQAQNAIDKSSDMPKDERDSSPLIFKPIRVDQFSRIFFPVAFLIFNIVYWVKYTT